MFFLTVGTQLPFDRLVRAVDEAFDDYPSDKQLFAQIGDSSYRPRNFEYTCHLDKHIFDDYIRKASGIISHAGIGTITIAMDHAKPLLVMPRIKNKGEVVNDHQVGLAGKFEKLGHLLVAYNEKHIVSKLSQLSTFEPMPRDNQADAVIERISSFLGQIGQKKADN